MTPTYRDEDLALIFDMDGVIIDSTAIHIEAWRLYLNSHGIEVPDLESRMLGRHNDEIVREFFPGGALTGDLVFSHGARKEQVYRNLIGAGVAAKLVPGIKEFLTHRCHLPMAIATNAEPANVDFILDGAGIRDCFNAIVSGHDVERPKPFPDIYLRAASLLQAPPGRCIVFEDSLTGVAAARAAGMRVVGVTTTIPAFEKVDLTIRDFRELQLESWLRAATSCA